MPGATAVEGEAWGRRLRPGRGGGRGAAHGGRGAAHGGRGAAHGGLGGGARRAAVTEKSERRGRRKEKARGAFISPLCRVPAIWHSAKIFFLILKYVLPSARSLALGKGGFAECQLTGTRQRVFLGSLPSVNRLTLGKAIFTECHNLTLGKIHLNFLNFVSQTFCGMFLHYVDLHVSFVDNYNRVFNR